MKKSKFYLIGLLSVIALGAILTFAYATNDNSSADNADQCLNKGEKSELALLKCGDEGEEEGEKKCGEGEKKECEDKEKKCGEGKCGESDDEAAEVEEVEEVEEAEE